MNTPSLQYVMLLTSAWEWIPYLTYLRALVTGTGHSLITSKVQVMFAAKREYQHVLGVNETNVSVKKHIPLVFIQGVICEFLIQHFKVVNVDILWKHWQLLRDIPIITYAPSGGGGHFSCIFPLRIACKKGEGSPDSMWKGVQN